VILSYTSYDREKFADSEYRYNSIWPSLKPNNLSPFDIMKKSLKIKLSFSVYSIFAIHSCSFEDAKFSRHSLLSSPKKALVGLVL
jgi:hypothetical protein